MGKKRAAVVIGVNRTGELPTLQGSAALYPLVDVDPAITNNGTVGNQTSNRHGIVGYLNDRNIARVVCEGFG
jgi:hypothetical protein